MTELVCRAPRSAVTSSAISQSFVTIRPTKSVSSVSPLTPERLRS